MLDNNSQTQPVDPVLRHAFQVIKQSPLRLTQDRQQGLKHFACEVDEMFSEVNGDATGFPSPSKINFNMIKEVFGLMNLKMRPLFTALSAILIACVFLFGGVGMTAYAAQSALPGDSLYAVKTRPGGYPRQPGEGPDQADRSISEFRTAAPGRNFSFDPIWSFYGYSPGYRGVRNLSG